MHNSTESKARGILATRGNKSALDIIAEYQAKRYKGEIASKDDYILPTEMVADIAGDFFGNEDSIRRIVNQNKNLAQRVYEWIKSTIKTLASKEQTKGEWYKELRKLEKMYAKLLNEPTTAKGEGARYAYEGEKTQKEYASAVDGRILEYIKKVKNGYTGNLRLKDLSKKAAEDIKRLTGINVDGYSVYLTPDTVRHIEKRHGERGTADHSMTDPNDLARIEYVLNSFDDIVLSKRKSRKYKNADSTKALTVLYSKRINGY